MYEAKNIKISIWVILSSFCNYLGVTAKIRPNDWYEKRQADTFNAKEAEEERKQLIALEKQMMADKLRFSLHF
jgi:hypothetical protein